jgi:hypothetical protein
MVRVVMESKLGSREVEPDTDYRQGVEIGTSVLANIY